MCTHFVCSHRGWRDVFPFRTKPSRYASLPSQCFCSIAHKLVKQPIIIVALGNKGLWQILATAVLPVDWRERTTLSCVILKHASTACKYSLLGTVSEMAAGSMTSMRKRCLFARSQLITAAQSGSSWARFCSLRYETSSSRFSLEGVKTRPN